MSIAAVSLLGEKSSQEGDKVQSIAVVSHTKAIANTVVIVIRLQKALLM